MSSSFPAEINFGALEQDELALWQRVAAHFRERFSNTDIMTSSTSTATPVRHAFESRVTNTKSPKSDINALILDYLTMEGYPKAAEKFSKEANLECQIEDNSTVRQQIRNSIHQGNIQGAIEALNNFDSEILDKDAGLHFDLLRLQLVELFRSSKDEGPIPAIKFATENLAPKACNQPPFLTKLETTMALFLYPPDQLTPELASLLHPDLRREVAEQVNKAILSSHTERREAAIRQLVKMRAWTEESARNAANGEYPDRIELGLHSEEVHGNSHENGHEPMITT